MNNLSNKTRRSFVKKSLMGLAAIPIYNLAGCSSKPESLPSIGLQLYTVRREMEKDIPGTLKKVKDAGYNNVESAFFPEGISIEEGGKMIKEAGLNVFSAHIELPYTDEVKNEWLRISDVYDCSRMIWHGWPENEGYKTEEGTKKLIDIYNEANQFAKSNGLSFGIHNHWWEYEKQESGKYPFELLLKGLDPDIFFEIDTYWVTVAGHNPVDIIKKFGDRAPLLHIKDGPANYSDSLDEDEPDAMVALGSGAMNIPGIAKAGRKTAKYLVVELDVVATDVFKAISESYKYLTENQYAQ